ncbi:hypothetical protein HID58_034873 [Brassica napus]|uniref:Protein kinase domain-containing protein n=1 Tax=Brassica napus TaxID=3708 RepID=A0ABQ8C399_BRANA|nr:hypothetical protein HID58_034873 [Brassica napus]
MNKKKQQVMKRGIQAAGEYGKGNYKQALELLGSDFNAFGYKMNRLMNEMWCQLLLKTFQSKTAKEVIRERIKVRDGVPFTWRLLEKSYDMEGNAEAESVGERGDFRITLLFDRKELRYFRKDGHNRRKKKDGKTVKEDHEKLKLLLAVKQCHEKGICHGDIKCENVLVTSWNWLYLADFASFKPTYIPYDDPSDFSFFHDTRERRLCYLAPEISEVAVTGVRLMIEAEYSWG